MGDFGFGTKAMVVRRGAGDHWGLFRRSAQGSITITSVRVQSPLHASDILVAGLKLTQDGLTGDKETYYFRPMEVS